MSKQVADRAWPDSLAGAHAPLILDVEGPALTAADRRRLEHPLVGGVIHFGRHWQNRAQLLALNAQIKAIRPDLLIAVDHEGGRVQRFRTDGFTHLPVMGRFGALFGADKGDGKRVLQAVQAATAGGYVVAAELRACGVDLSFAPVLDLDWRGDDGKSRSRVIGDRSFSSDPRVVSLLAQAWTHGMLQAGMAACGKHFPGHGHVVADSHVDVPVDKRSLAAIRRDDLQPFSHLATSLAGMMPAHVIYPKVDNRPAGFSARWLQDILRGELAFDGVIFSDDLSMAGARQMGGQALTHAQAALAALDAGCDLVLLCNQSLNGGQVLDDALGGLESAWRQGSLPLSEASAKRRLALLAQTEPMPWDDLMRSPRYVRSLESLAAV